jgi:hypothetical protein
VREGLLAAGEPEDASAVAHWGEALLVRVPWVSEGVQQRVRQGKAPEQDALKRGKRA